MTTPSFHHAAGAQDVRLQSPGPAPSTGVKSLFPYDDDHTPRADVFFKAASYIRPPLPSFRSARASVILPSEEDEGNDGQTRMPMLSGRHQEPLRSFATRPTEECNEKSAHELGGHSSDQFNKPSEGGRNSGSDVDTSLPASSLLLHRPRAKKPSPYDLGELDDGMRTRRDAERVLNRIFAIRELRVRPDQLKKERERAVKGFARPGVPAGVVHATQRERIEEAHSMIKRLATEYLQQRANPRKRSSASGGQDLSLPLDWTQALNAISRPPATFCPELYESPQQTQSMRASTYVPGSFANEQARAARRRKDALMEMQAEFAREFNNEVSTRVYPGVNMVEKSPKRGSTVPLEHDQQEGAALSQIIRAATGMPPLEVEPDHPLGISHGFGVSKSTCVKRREEAFRKMRATADFESVLSAASVLETLESRPSPVRAFRMPQTAPTVEASAGGAWQALSEKAKQAGKVAELVSLNRAASRRLIPRPTCPRPSTAGGIPTHDPYGLDDKTDDQLEETGSDRPQEPPSATLLGDLGNGASISEYLKMQRPSVSTTKNLPTQEMLRSAATSIADSSERVAETSNNAQDSASSQHSEMLTKGVIDKIQEVDQQRQQEYHETVLTDALQAGLQARQRVYEQAGKVFPTNQLHPRVGYVRTLPAIRSAPQDHDLEGAPELKLSSAGAAAERVYSRTSTRSAQKSKPSATRIIVNGANLPDPISSKPKAAQPATVAHEGPRESSRKSLLLAAQEAAPISWILTQVRLRERGLLPAPVSRQSQRAYQTTFESCLPSSTGFGSPESVPAPPNDSISKGKTGSGGDVPGREVPHDPCSVEFEEDFIQQDQVIESGADKNATTAAGPVEESELPPPPIVIEHMTPILNVLLQGAASIDPNEQVSPMNDPLNDEVHDRTSLRSRTGSRPGGPSDAIHTRRVVGFGTQYGFGPIGTRQGYGKQMYHQIRTSQLHTHTTSGERTRSSPPASPTRSGSPETRRSNSRQRPLSRPSTQELPRPAPRRAANVASLAGHDMTAESGGRVSSHQAEESNGARDASTSATESRPSSAKYEGGAVNKLETAEGESRETEVNSVGATSEPVEGSLIDEPFIPPAELEIANSALAVVE